ASMDERPAPARRSATIASRASAFRARQKGGAAADWLVVGPDGTATLALPAHARDARRSARPPAPDGVRQPASVQHARPARAEARAARAVARERAQLPAVVLAQVLEHVEVPVAAAHAEVIGVAAVPAVEEVVDLDRVLAENEAAGSLAGALGTALDLDAHAGGLAPVAPRRQDRPAARVSPRGPRP